MKRAFSARSWTIWLLSTAVLSLITRNPLYLIIILLAARIVQNSCGEDERTIKISFWRLSAVILLFSVLFNLLLVHIGQTVLFRLPQNLWLVGGSLTLEALIYGAISALILITLLAVFMAYNSVVSTSDLIAMAPRALANIGIVVLIAVSYVPETLNHLQRVREAQALRGHKVRGMRDWQPIIIPLLVGGLERSMNLAETMVARGYGATSSVGLSSAMRLLLLAGLVFILGGWLVSFQYAVVGWVLVVAGAACLLVAYLRQGRQISRTRYAQVHWQAQDWLLVILSLLPLALALLPFPGLSGSSLSYTPYPLAAVPEFDPLMGIALAMLAAPAVIADL